MGENSLTVSHVPMQIPMTDLPPGSAQVTGSKLPSSLRAVRVGVGGRISRGRRWWGKDGGESLFERRTHSLGEGFDELDRVAVVEGQVGEDGEGGVDDAVRPGVRNWVAGRIYLRLVVLVRRRLQARQVPARCAMARRVRGRGPEG